MAGAARPTWRWKAERLLATEGEEACEGAEALSNVPRAEGRIGRLSPPSGLHSSKSVSGANGGKPLPPRGVATAKPSDAGPAATSAPQRVAATRATAATRDGAGWARGEGTKLGSFRWPEPCAASPPPSAATVSHDEEAEERWAEWKDDLPGLTSALASEHLVDTSLSEAHVTGMSPPPKPPLEAEAVKFAVSKRRL